jgi:polysaccharide biosynthesis/export protein
MPHTGSRMCPSLGRKDDLAIPLTRVLQGGWVTAVCLLLFILPARAEFPIDAGDVIEIIVARMPDLQRRVTVKPDGSISFPLLGTISVAGSTPAQLQAKVQSILAAKVFQQRAADGRQIETAIDPAEIIAAVVERRPVYVNGDVFKPGEYAYRPFMTVRQAIAMSGGYDVLRMRMGYQRTEIADLRSTYISLWAEIAKDRSQIWRIKSELGDDDNVDQSVLLDVPSPLSKMMQQVIKIESEQLAISQADNEKQKAFLKSAIEQGEEQIVILTQQQQKEEQGVKADTADLQKAIELYGQGSLPSPRVLDNRRAVLLSSTRLLQTRSQLLQVKRQQDDLRRQVQKLDDQRRIDLLRQLQEATARINSSRARLQGVLEKIQYTTNTTQLLRENEAKPDIAIFRKHRERINADENFELEPGDVVEISLRALNAPMLPVDAAVTGTVVPGDRAAAANGGPLLGNNVER